MSCGFGVGDFIAVSSLAVSLHRSFKGAPREFQETSRQLESLHIVLADLNLQSKEPESLLNRQGPMRESELKSIGKNLKDTMEELEDIHERYQRMGRISWARFEFGQKDLAAIRGKLTLQIAAFNAFMASLSIGVLGRMEPMLLRMYQLLEERAKNSEVMAQTILSITSDVTNHSAWDRVRMEPRTEGVSDDYFRHNEQEIIEVARIVADVNNLVGDEFSYALDDHGPSPNDSISQVSSNIRYESLSPINRAETRNDSLNSRLADITLFPSAQIFQESNKRFDPAPAVALAASDPTSNTLSDTILRRNPWMQRLTPE
jgi:hypothetical protein